MGYVNGKNDIYDLGSNDDFLISVLNQKVCNKAMPVYRVNGLSAGEFLKPLTKSVLEVQEFDCSPRCEPPELCCVSRIQIGHDSKPRSLISNLELADVFGNATQFFLPWKDSKGRQYLFVDYKQLKASNAVYNVGLLTDEGIIIC